MEPLNVDPERWALKDSPHLKEHGVMVYKTGPTSAKFIRPTDIYVRAKNPTDGKWDNIDICFLDTPSLLDWLQSRGGDNPWAENTVLLILGHTTQGGPHQAKFV